MCGSPVPPSPGWDGGVGPVRWLRCLVPRSLCGLQLQCGERGRFSVCCLPFIMPDNSPQKTSPIRDRKEFFLKKKIPDGRMWTTENLHRVSLPSKRKKQILNRVNCGYVQRKPLSNLWHVKGDRLLKLSVPFLWKSLPCWEHAKQALVGMYHAVNCYLVTLWRRSVRGLEINAIDLRCRVPHSWNLFIFEIFQNLSKPFSFLKTFSFLKHAGKNNPYVSWLAQRIHKTAEYCQRSDWHQLSDRTKWSDHHQCLTTGRKKAVVWTTSCFLEGSMMVQNTKEAT